MSTRPDSTKAPSRRWWSLAVASLATLIVTVDTGQLSIALPLIIREFNADLALASWIALVYAFFTAALYLPCGRLSDLFGIGRLFLAGFLIYSGSSLAAGLAQGSLQLVVFRALQAVGSALIMANNFALVTALFAPAERGRAMGIAGGTISALGYTLGPVLGGVVTHSLGWRANFYLSAVLALAGFAAARLLLPRESFRGAGERKEPFDFVGMISFGASISVILLALALVQRGEWRTLSVAGAAMAGMITLAFFVWWERRSAYPLLDLSLFRIPAFSFGNGARLISFIAMSVTILLMPFFIQLAMGLDPLAAGFLVAPTPLAMALLAPLTGWMSEKFLPERLCALGMAVTAAAFVYLGFLTSGATAAQVIFGLALLGIGMGIFQTPNNNLLMSSVPRHRLGVGSSVLSIVRSLGYSGGAALAAAIVSSRLAHETGQTSLEFLQRAAPPEAQAVALAAFLGGFQYACLAGALFCVIGALVSAVPVSRDYR